jgi:hypothetical protein
MIEGSNLPVPYQNITPDVQSLVMGLPQWQNNVFIRAPGAFSIQLIF